MSVWVLIPIKARAACKLRLAPALSAGERLRLVRAMLRHVAGAAARAGGVYRVALLSNERDEAPGRLPLIPDLGTDLNSALLGALPELSRRGATGLVVLPADLPLLNAADVSRLAAVARAGATAIAPDWRELGTNALATPLDPPTGFAFGERSFAAHMEAARRFGVEPVIVRSPGLACDLDEPQHLDRAAGLLDPPIVAGRQLAEARAR